MSALRWPRETRAVIVVPVQTHGSETYTRDFRISVDHIVLYHPHGRDENVTLMQIVGRSQPLRVLLAAKEIDALVCPGPIAAGSPDPADYATPRAT